MPGLLAHFPDLPETLDNTQWSYEVHSAHQILRDGYHSAHLLLRREDGDAMRLRHHSQRITSNLVHLLEALEQEGLPMDWIVSCAHALAGLKVDLESAASGAEQEYVTCGLHSPCKALLGLSAIQPVLRRKFISLKFILATEVVPRKILTKSGCTKLPRETGDLI
jgi:hypothetical protein